MFGKVKYIESKTALREFFFGKYCRTSIENMDKNISDKTELESVIKFYSILCTEQQKHREEKKNTQTYHDKKREHDLRICFKRKMNARGEIFYHIMDRKAYRNCGV